MISVMSSLDKIAYSLFYEVMKILQNLFFILLSCIFPRVALAQSLSSGLYPEPQHIVISNEQKIYKELSKKLDKFTKIIVANNNELNIKNVIYFDMGKEKDNNNEEQ